MNGRHVLTVTMAGLLAAGTAWAQMGDDENLDAGRKGPERFHKRTGGGGDERFGRGPERGPGMRRGPGGPDEKREPPMEMIVGRLIQNPKVAAELGLTEDQIAKMRETLEQIREEMPKLTEQMQDAAEEQVKLLQAETVDEAAVMTAVEKTGELRTAIAKLRVKGMLVVKQTLTTEQIAKVKEYMQNRREKMDEGRGPRDRNGGFSRDRVKGEGGIRGGWGERNRDKDKEDPGEE